jgi:hypothetical protein
VTACSCFSRPYEISGKRLRAQTGRTDLRQVIGLLRIAIHLTGK